MWKNCPDCETGWTFPEPGEHRLRRCPTCGGNGRIRRETVALRRKDRI